MPDRCVVYGCSRENSLESGISLHKIPFLNDDRPEAKKRRKKWTDFVSIKRKEWTATKHSVVCSEHFRFDDFERYAVEIPNSKEAKPRLKRDEFGISVFPTRQVPKKDLEPSARGARQVKVQCGCK